MHIQVNGLSSESLRDINRSVAHSDLVLNPSSSELLKNIINGSRLVNFHDIQICNSGLRRDVLIYRPIDDESRIVIELSTKPNAVDLASVNGSLPITRSKYILQDNGTEIRLKDGVTQIEADGITGQIAHLNQNGDFSASRISAIINACSEEKFKQAPAA